jgi:hypothetical protein
MSTIASRYLAIRSDNPWMSAVQALQLARHEAAVDALSERVSWEYAPDFLIGRVDGLEIRVYCDDEPYDWGDVDLDVIGVAVHVEGEDEPIPLRATSNGRDWWWSDMSCWGIGFTSGDAEREALSFVISAGWLDAGRTELAERAYWRDREVLTV